MLLLDKIQLTHFKNYRSGRFDFGNRVTGICGLNGKGKTNLLDAIYYSCFTKSYFSPSDAMNVLFGEQGFRIESDFKRSGELQKVTCVYRGANKKELSLNGIPYEKFSKHIGFLPVVMIAPDDAELITAGSELRRRFMDAVLSQVDSDYLQHLITYNKILVQRNSLLKNFNAGGSVELLNVLDEQLVKPAIIIYEKRAGFMVKMQPLIEQFYRMISSGAEFVEVKYVSQLNGNNLMELLQSSLERDIYLQRTTQGIHKDDLGFSLNGQVFKNSASQGQRKSLLFALKLGEYELIKSIKGFPPILLLDDVFEKLDATRMNNLLHWVCKENEGQVFITDTHRDRLESTFAELDINGQILEL